MKNKVIEIFIWICILLSLGAAIHWIFFDNPEDYPYKNKEEWMKAGSPELPDCNPNYMGGCD